MSYSLNVNYDGKAKTLKFEGNFGFKADGKTFMVKNNQLFINGKLAKDPNIKLSHEAAYQLLGMSNIDGKGGQYVLNKADLELAQKLFNEDMGVKSGSSDDRFAYRMKTLIGKDAGKHYGDIQHNNVKDGIFNTTVTSKSTGVDSHVSIWSLDKK
jgi:hypothetical protein